MADRRLVAALLAAGLLAVSGCSGGQGDTGGVITGLTTNDDDGLYGSSLTKAYVVPDVSLDDTSGASYDLATDPHKPLTLVFFGYTRCPDICQVVMSALASAMTRLDAEQRSSVDVVFVTTDPARDDEATLRKYLDRFDPGFIGLTGPLSKIIDLGTALGVPVEHGQKLPSGGYEVAHGTQVIAINRHHRAPVVWTQGTSAQDFADDIATLLARGQ